MYRRAQNNGNFPQIHSYHDINENIHKFTIENVEYTYVELAGSHTYILKLTLARLLALPPALDLAKLGVLPGPMGCGSCPSWR